MARKRRRATDVDGVLIIDKPGGMTSHDVVSRVRRTMNMSRVGHAGTLDPMATGVLVVMLGEATKLARFLSSDDKSYRATIQLGLGTDTLDAEGEQTANAPLPDWWRHDQQRADRIEAALATERARGEQQPPSYSAIKVAGKRAYARTRAGEDVELQVRPVTVRSLEASAPDVDAGQLELTLRVSKGYYVRSLARDLGAALDLPAHLCALRRTASGTFPLDIAIDLEGDLASGVIPLREAALMTMPAARLTADGVARARCGGPMGNDDFSEMPAEEGPSLWLAPEGEPVAIGAVERAVAVVLRGFVSK